MVTAAGARAETAAHYALAVARTAYRRGYATATVAMTQAAAAELAEDQLFAHLLTVSRKRRTAHHRLEAIRTAWHPQRGQNQPTRPRGKEGSPP